MSKEQLPSFTPAQIAAMEQSREVLNVIDEATRDHIVTYNPEDDPPYFESFDKLRAKNQVGKRTLALTLPNGVLRIYLQRRFAASKPKPFGNGEWDTVFEEPEYEPYYPLKIAYNGLVHIGFRDSEKEDDYTAYRIHQPKGRLHNLGLIVATTLVHKREITPIDRQDDEEFKTATRRLFNMAASSEDSGQAEELEKIAEGAAQQEYIVSDSYEPEGGYSILDAAGAQQLTDTLRLALAYGEEDEN